MRKKVNQTRVYIIIHVFHQSINQSINQSIYVGKRHPLLEKHIW